MKPDDDDADDDDDDDDDDLPVRPRVVAVLTAIFACASRGEGACNASRITCYTSHVTRHTLSVTPLTFEPDIGRRQTSGCSQQRRCMCV